MAQPTEKIDVHPMFTRHALHRKSAGQKISIDGVDVVLGAIVALRMTAAIQIEDND